MTDKLEGYRGNVTQFARKIVEETQTPSAELWERIYVGSAALKLMQGVASRDEIARVMAHVIAQCEMDVQQDSAEFLSYSDPACPEARAAHFRGRVAAAVIGRINQLVHAAQVAGDEINHGPRE